MKRPSTKRRHEAAKRAAQVLVMLRGRGVEVSVVGSLANGTFGPTSDVDFLITKCPISLKYRIESAVEDQMGDIPFDVVYREEAKEFVLRKMERHAINDPERLIK
jgi:predicted nucleotidyltransferase